MHRIGPAIEAKAMFLAKLKSRSIITLVAVLLLGCQGLDSDEASRMFADCLERNGVEAEDVVVTMDGNTVVEVSLVVVSEGDVAYEPALRQACTEEVELAD